MALGCGSRIHKRRMMYRREYNRRVREVVEASWLASSAAEASEPALENGHAAEQQPESAPAAACAPESSREAEGTTEAAEPHPKRQRVEESAAAT